MLDTCVYIDVIHGEVPPAVDTLLRDRIVNHSTVCVAELAHTLGRLDPEHVATRAALRPLELAIAAIPSRRLTVPSERAFGESGMLAGLTMRLAGEGRPRALQNDALLYLHALERGFVVLTRNVREFDYFDQLLPAGRVLFYRRLA